MPFTQLFLQSQLTAMHAEILNNIGALLDAIDKAFKYPAVKNSWEISATSAAGEGEWSLLNYARQKNLLTYHGNQEQVGYEWLINVQKQINKRKDMLHVATSGQKTHALLPFCFFIADKIDSGKYDVDGDLEVFLAGFFLMTDEKNNDDGSKKYVNSGVLFLVDLISNLPSTAHIRQAFIEKQQRISAITTGSAAIDDYESEHLTNLFTMLAENVQLDHYSHSLEHVRERLKVAIENPDSDDASLLRIKFEHSHITENRNRNISVKADSEEAPTNGPSNMADDKED